ncbi:hypothetical protein [Methylobacterium sp.]|uniref:hypothetical protein n=1 Tax=Methylobacterium sp. TaxID=409 RepID=UPI000FAC1A68|nr:hypothetical protein [Methylobacterium sp.]RUP22326.1 MAG: hypothetical protein EKK44_05475 [Methylobacterium sp.]
MQPRSLDEARRLYPAIGFALYAMDPKGPVTLELLDPEVSDQIPLSWTAATEARVWEQAFPPTPIEPVDQGSFMPPEGSPARAELAAAVDDPTAGLASELAAELAAEVGGLFD